LGAAYATCISFMIMAFAMYFINIRLIPVRLEMKKIMLIIFFLLVGFISFHIFDDMLEINIVIMFFYLLCMIYFRIINVENLNKIIKN